MRRRIRISISGEVQGVFFRRSAKIKAETFGIFGWVKNNQDGSVEVMAQGEKGNVAKFMKWCKIGPPFAKVEKVEASEQKGLEDFEDFSIHD